MYRAHLIAAAALLVAGAPAVRAQRGPGGPGQAPFGVMRDGGPLGATAEFLLSHTGDLRLSDNQVVRLASIARRSAERRRTMRDSLEDMRPAMRGPMRGDSVDRAQRRQEFERNAERMRARMDRLREQSEDDRRDAIAVLTADQQAQAWELVATRGRGMSGGRPSGGASARRD